MEARSTINLTFHGIGVPARDVPADEARLWIREDRFRSILELVAGRDDVRLTFDDGNASDVERALPALRCSGLRAWFFVSVGRLGAPGYLDVEGVRELARAGMTVGCHGMRHRSWRALGERALHEELVEARLALEAAVGAPVSHAACPFGAYDRRVLRALRSEAYRHVFTSDGGTSRPADWLQPRTTIGADDDAAALLARLDGRRSAARALARRAKLTAKRWR